MFSNLYAHTVSSILYFKSIFPVHLRLPCLLPLVYKLNIYLKINVEISEVDIDWNLCWMCKLETIFWQTLEYDQYFVTW